MDRLKREIKKYRKKSDEAFWRLAYKLAMDYNLIPIGNGVYLLKEKKRNLAGEVYED